MLFSNVFTITASDKFTAQWCSCEAMMHSYLNGTLERLIVLLLCTTRMKDTCLNVLPCTISPYEEAEEMTNVEI